MTHPHRKRGFLSSFIVRKNPKKHGLEKKIEGKLQEPILIVDDVITSGRSIQSAIDAIRKENFNVEGVIWVLDREEIWGKKIFSLFRHSEFKDYIHEKLKQME